ncbi:hypothetical protein STEG23_021697, partial [Scotinomys teguina]
IDKRDDEINCGETYVNEQKAMRIENHVGKKNGKIYPYQLPTLKFSQSSYGPDSS